MTRTSTRARAILALSVAGLAVPSSAMAAPTTPELLPAPAFVEGTNPTFLYIPGQFDINSPGVYTVSNKRHEISVRDLSTGAAPEVHIVNFPDIPVVPLTLSNGHQYAIKVRARELIDPVVGPNVTQSSDWTPEEVTRVDATAPTGPLDIAGGAQFVNTRDVTLTLGASDPLSNGFTGSGVSKYQISNTAAFPCGGTSCPVNFAETPAHQLADGPDGPRTVRVKFRDAARHFFGAFDTTPGNESAVISDTVLLDRLAPTANFAALPAQVLQGAPVAFDATTSVDGAAGPNDSGVDPASYQWSFGDGTSGSGVSLSHTYGTPGLQRHAHDQGPCR